MRIDEVTDREGFAALESEWDQLLTSSRQDSVFVTHDRLSAWLHSFGSDVRPRVMTCRGGGGDLLGVLPCYVRRQGRIVPARVLRLLGDEGVAAASLGAVAALEAEAEVFQCLAKHIARGRDWDVVDFNYLDPSGDFFRGVSALPAASVIARADCCPRIPLPGDWKTYLASLSQNHRHNVKRTLRRLEESGVELETVEHAKELPEALDDLVRLQHARLRERFGPGYTMPESYREYTGRTMDSDLRTGSLRLLFFRLDGRRIAAFHAHRYGDTMYANRTGFDRDVPAQNILRPLWATMIKGAIEEGCTVCDTMNGDFEYKSTWGASEVLWLSRVRSYGTTPAGSARRVRDWSVAHIGT